MKNIFRIILNFTPMLLVSQIASAEIKHVYYCVTERAVTIQCDVSTGQIDCSKDKINHGQLDVSDERFTLVIKNNIWPNSQYCGEKPDRFRGMDDLGEKAIKRSMEFHNANHERKLALQCNPAAKYMVELPAETFPNLPFMYSFNGEDFSSLDSLGMLNILGEGYFPKKEFTYTISQLGGFFSRIKQGSCRSF